MFTGLIEATASVVAWQGNTLTCSCALAMRVGDSVAVNGCCLTVSEVNKGNLSCHISDETLSCTHFADLQVGNLLNIERPLRLHDRLHGHLLSGHVDTVATVTHFARQTEGAHLSVHAPKNISHYLQQKGSCALQGVSLTINSLSSVDAKSVQIALFLLPTTLQKTNLRMLTTMQQLNLEVDMLGKYLHNLLAERGK